ncbi:S16 family serine protease [Haloarcula sp. H-GB4]|uniref:S16 family serine protease n=1 Tax=Haloarcula sp. H-GB4 TaxID=3069755 RepID=UPI0027B652D7|nr:S16 family serine protease [Haloarcula sp. H-GB4]MDQ2074691.1 S16 family serine protease [Haloarcula sp. H-GB4]
MNTDRTLILLLVGIVVLNLSWTGAVNNRTGSLESRVETVEQDQESMAVFAGTNQSRSDTTSATASLYAYNTATGKATVVPAEIDAVPASGVYLDVAPVAHTATVQRSIVHAWSVANESQSPPPYRGTVIRINPPESWDTVGGGSAALSLASGFAATNPCIELNGSVAMTGGLTRSGTVIEVQHVREKAVAAKDRGVTVFVVPQGQAVDVDGIRVVEVATFAEATNYTLGRTPVCRSEAAKLN